MLSKIPVLALVLCMALSTQQATHAVEPQSIDATRAEFQEIAKTVRDSKNLYLGFGQLHELEGAVQKEGLTSEERQEAAGRYASELLRVGMVEQGIEVIEAIMEDPRLAELDADSKAHWRRLRGLAYLRLSELDNCIINHNSECCVFPLQGGGLHDNAAPAAKARENLLAYLKFRPDSSEVQWLINVLSMALGDYPDAVDPDYRVPVEAFDGATGSLSRFENVAPALGVDTLSAAGGSVVDDFTNNGYLDIVTSGMNPANPLRFLVNGGESGFEDRSEAAGLDAQLGGLHVVQADYDNDGFLDLIVLRGAWMRTQGEIRNSLLRNRGDGSFEDVTHAAGVATPVAPTQVAVWFDFDNDGLLDLFIGNEDFSAFDPNQRYASNLFRNNGDGTFTDVAEEAGLTIHRYVKGAAAGDFNNNGHLDLYVSNLFGPNQLFQNNGDGTFQEIGEKAGVTEPSGESFLPVGQQREAAKKGASFPCFFFDFDNDGWLDILVGDYTATLGDVLNDYRGKAHNATLPVLYRNNGDGTFTDIAQEAGLTGAYRVMGMGFGDLDNDGWLDIFLTTGTPDYFDIMPNRMLRNTGKGRFEDVTTIGGFGNLQKGHGVSFADINNNGHQDVHHQQGGAFPGDEYQNALYLNPGSPGAFVYLQLRGTQSNHFGVGARVTVAVDSPEGERKIHRQVGLGSSFGSNPMRLEIGLGEATAIHHVEVWWPSSGIKTNYNDLKPNTQYLLREGLDTAEEVPLKAITFRALHPNTKSGNH